MRIVKITEFDDCREMERYLTLPDPAMRPVLMAQLAGLLTHSPSAVMVLKVVDEAGGMAGFLMAQQGPGEVIEVTQTWVKSGVSSNVLHEMFFRVTLWAVASGKSVLRATTTRDPAAWQRRIGFEVVGHIIERRIDSEMLGDLMLSTREVFNGRILQQAKGSDQEHAVA